MVLLETGIPSNMMLTKQTVFLTRFLEQLLVKHPDTSVTAVKFYAIFSFQESGHLGI